MAIPFLNDVDKNIPHKHGYHRKKRKESKPEYLWGMVIHLTAIV